MVIGVIPRRARRLRAFESTPADAVDAVDLDAPIEDGDTFLDAVVLVCVVEFLLIAVGIGLLVLQAAAVLHWPR